MMQQHSMPFGAEFTPKGVRFRLYAPAADSILLDLEGADEPVALTKQDGSH